MVSSDHRFSHLLQPIRDLAKNWNIDLATDLEDYLEELDKISVTFDGGKTNLNFAEAALLIQGSACIYSKKVEYLYALLNHVWELVTQQRKEIEKEASADSADFEDEEPEFLLLDDLKEAENIDLVEDEHEISGSRSEKNTLIPKPPAVLLALSDDPNKDVQYKSSNCFMHTSGAILLEESDKGRITNASLTISMDAIPHDVSETPFVPEHQEVHHDLNDDDDVAQEFSDNEELPEMEVSPGGHPPMALENRAKNVQSKYAEAYDAAESFEDPWALLSAHDDIPSLNRPFRKGKTYRQPRNMSRRRIESFLWAAPSLNVPAAPISSSALKNPFFSEFDGIASQVSKKRSRARKELKEGSLLMGTDEAYVNDVEDDQEPLAFDNDMPDDPLFEDDDEIQSIHEEEIGSGWNDNSTDSYAQLCKNYVEQYRASTENCVQETGLSRRVSLWQQKILPMIQEQESRPAFDIHDYGEKVVDLFDKMDLHEGDEMTFQDLTQEVHAPRFEVCRLFLTSLQLANNGNLDIVKDGDNVTFKLLKSNIDRHIEGYQAPSQATAA